MPVSQTIESLHLIGASDVMQQLYKVIGRICNADCAVLLIGEKGCGKSMVARALHYYSHRAQYPFQMIDGTQARETNDEDLLGLDETHAFGSTCYITAFHPCRDLFNISSFRSTEKKNINVRTSVKCENIIFVLL